MAVLLVLVGWIGHRVGHWVVDGPVDGHGLGHRHRMGQGYRLGQIERHLLGKLHREWLLHFHRHVMRNFHYLRHGYCDRVVYRHRHGYVMRYLRADERKWGALRWLPDWLVDLFICAPCDCAGSADTARALPWRPCGICFWGYAISKPAGICKWLLWGRQ